MDTQRDRSSLAYKARYALRQPAKIPPYLRRAARNRWIRLRYRDHVNYYREVMRHNVAKNPDMAIGTPTRKRWMALGSMQFDYLVDHGLKPSHRLLEIGCGNLRAGWRFIDYLDAGNYYGVDISPDILFSAEDVLVEFDLQGKLPYLVPVRDLTLRFLPAGHFDVVHAHSVFSHCPIDVIDECFANVGLLLKPDGFFDFTYNATEGPEHQVEREDYWYRPRTLIDLAGKYGLHAEPMDDWAETGHKQSKMRLRRRE